MPGGVGVDAPAPPVRSIVQDRCAQCQHLLLGTVQIRDAEVQVELLGPGRVGPLRWLVVHDALEGQDETGRRV